MEKLDNIKEVKVGEQQTEIDPRSKTTADRAYNLIGTGGPEMEVKGQGAVPFNQTGSIFLFANNFEHAVFNDSDHDRYHMIIHGYPDDYRISEHFRKLVVEGYRSLLPGIH